MECGCFSPGGWKLHERHVPATAREQVVIILHMMQTGDGPRIIILPINPKHGKGKNPIGELITRLTTLTTMPAYARLKNLQLTYTIPQKIQKAVLLQGAEIYFSGQNLLLLYSGNKIMDPELGSPTNYPLMKVFSIGAKLAF